MAEVLACPDKYAAYTYSSHFIIAALLTWALVWFWTQRSLAVMAGSFQEWPGTTLYYTPSNCCHCVVLKRHLVQRRRMKVHRLKLVAKFPWPCEILRDHGDRFASELSRTQGQQDEAQLRAE